MIEQKEAETILKILFTADGGCSYCAARLALQFVEAFPQYKELAQSMYYSEFNENLEED